MAGGPQNTPDLWDPTLSPLYRDVLAHYGVVALPRRVRDPDRKGKVESDIGFTQGALKGLRFERLDEEGQAYLDRWETRWADTRIHGTTKRQVAAMFAEEQPHLLPLPVEPFRYYQYATRTVHLDGCGEVALAYYAAPPGWMGREVTVQWNATAVRLLDPATGQLLREHRPQRRGQYAIPEADRPHRTPPTTLQLLARATRAGAHVGTLCATLHQREGERGVRPLLGVLALVKKHGPPAVDAACAAALECDVADYRFVRRYLDRHPAGPLTLTQVDPLIRELTRTEREERNLIDHVPQRLVAGEAELHDPLLASSGCGASTRAAGSGTGPHDHTIHVEASAPGFAASTHRSSLAGQDMKRGGPVPTGRWVNTVNPAAARGLPEDPERAGVIWRCTARSRRRTRGGWSSGCSVRHLQVSRWRMREREIVSVEHQVK